MLTDTDKLDPQDLGDPQDPPGDRVIRVLTDVMEFQGLPVCQDLPEMSLSLMQILLQKHLIKLKPSEKSLDNTCLQCVELRDPRA